MIWQQIKIRTSILDNFSTQPEHDNKSGMVFYPAGTKFRIESIDSYFDWADWEMLQVHTCDYVSY